MGRILGIDYGKKRIGLAVTDDLQMIASPLDVYINDINIMDRLKKLTEKYKFEKIVIGYPHSDTYTEAVKNVIDFADKLKSNLNLEIIYQNEEFTSVYAESFLKSLGLNKKKVKLQIDRLSAQKILSNYLLEKEK